MSCSPISAAGSPPPISRRASGSSPIRPGRAPLVRTICRGLADSRDGTLRAGYFLDLLRSGFGPEDARRQLDIAIDWGRYAELYDYDTDSDRITADPAAHIF